jgi:dolichyl-diphosphooligosaccharide--protein glycosyltransferase
MSDTQRTSGRLLLVVILLLGFGVRLIFLQKEYLWGVDPYYHYSNFLSLVESASLLPLSLYTPAQLVYLPLKPLGFSPYDSFRLTAPIFGVLTIIPVYLITRRAFDEKTAMVSSFILAFLPAFIDRTIAGNYRGDPFAFFFAVWGFYFFLEGGQRFGRRCLALSFLAGLSFAISGAVWSSGYIFAMVVITGFAVLDSVLSYISGRESRGVFFSYVTSAGLGILIIKLLAKHSLIQKVPMGFDDFSSTLYPAIIMVLIVLEVLRSPTSSWAPRKRAVMVSIAGLVAVAIFLSCFDDIFDRFLNIFGKSTRFRGGSYQFTLELQGMDTGFFWQRFNIVGIFFVLGFLSTIRDLSNRYNLFLIPWVASSLFLMHRVGLRGAFTASFALAILGACGLLKFVTYVKTRGFHESPVPQILLVSLLLFSAYEGVQYSTALEPLINDNWVDALEWIEGNTPENSVVLSDWNYGYWIMGIAHRKPVIKPAQNQRRIEQVYSMFLEEKEAKVEPIIKRYKVDYVLLASDIIFLVPNMESILNKSNYMYIIFPYKGRAHIRQVPAEVYGDEKVFIVQDNGMYYGYVLEDDSLLPVRLIYYQGSERFETIGGDGQKIAGTFYLSNGNDHLPVLNTDNFILYIPPLSENTFLTSLLIQRGERYDGMELVYSNPQIKVYEVTG